jgi:peptidoglycan hydrolase CwlO-like protein
MNPQVQTSGEVLKELEETQKQLETKVQEFDEAVQSVVQQNGSAENVRKSLRKKLKKSRFLKACESAFKC